MNHREKMERLSVCLSCLKSASRSQALRREEYRAAPSEETEAAWLRQCEQSREYEREILGLWS